MNGKIDKLQSFKISFARSNSFKWKKLENHKNFGKYNLQILANTKSRGKFILKRNKKGDSSLGVAVGLFVILPLCVFVYFVKNKF